MDVVQISGEACGNSRYNVSNATRLECFDTAPYAEQRFPQAAASGLMRRLPWNSILPWLLSAFFVVGGVINIVASEAILSDYNRWGYPTWFHYVTGLLEFTAAMLIFRAESRRAGAALAAVIMFSAAATVLAHGEFTRAIAPLVVLSFAVAILLRTGVKKKRPS